MRDKSKMRYRGVCVGGPRDGQEMAHDHRERIEHGLLNNTFIVTGGPSFDEQWPRIPGRSSQHSSSRRRSYQRSCINP